MKKLILLVLIFFFCPQLMGQILLNVPGVTFENVCNSNSVYFFLIEKPEPLETIDSVEQRLNRQVPYARENPAFRANPVIQLAISCKGEIGGGFHMVVSSGIEQLDDQLMDFFKTIGPWVPGRLKDNYVDSWYQWKINISSGIFNIIN